MAEFNVGGDEWEAIQSNGFKVVFNIDQSGTQLSGDADAHHFPPGPAPSIDGNIEPGSRVKGNSFLVRIEFANGSRNEMSGTFDLDGRLTGHALDLAMVTPPATWVSNKRFSQQ